MRKEKCKLGSNHIFLTRNIYMRNYFFVLLLITLPWKNCIYIYIKLYFKENENKKLSTKVAMKHNDSFFILPNHTEVPNVFV